MRTAIPMTEMITVAVGELVVVVRLHRDQDWSIREYRHRGRTLELEASAGYADRDAAVAAATATVRRYSGAIPG